MNPITQTALTTSPSSNASGDNPVLDLIAVKLAALDAKIEDIRSQLAAKRKGHYTIEEFANLVGRSAYTIRRWVSEGRIKAIRIEGTGPKGRLLVPRDQLDALIASGLGASIPAAAIN